MDIRRSTARRSTLRADYVREGMWLTINHEIARYVAAVTGNGRGKVVLRCNYSGPGVYASCHVTLDPAQTVQRIHLSAAEAGR